MSTAPRLLLLSTEFPPGPGGIGMHAYQLARHLAARGWSVTVATPQAYVSADACAEFNRRQPFAVVTLPERDSSFTLFCFASFTNDTSHGLIFLFLKSGSQISACGS